MLLLALSVAASGPSGTLPVIHINLNNGGEVPPKTEGYAEAVYWLDANGCAGVESVGSEASPLALGIRGRGNYTWVGFDKKPYRLKLAKKASFAGLPKSKHWALLAHADDNRGFMRNATGFAISRLAGLAWTPGDVPVEVVLNGEYRGLYFLTETVRVDADRVDVVNTDDAVEDWLEANPGKTAADYPWTDEEATGGWLVEIDNYDDADQIKLPSLQGDNYTLRVTYDTPSDYITDAQKAFLRSEFETIDRLIIEGDRSLCEWSDKVDLTSAAKFFVVNQLVGNYESYHGSCKMWRRQGSDEKWHFGPVWDFGSAFQSDASMVQPIWVEQPHTQHWIKAMYEFPAFKDEVCRVYAELMDGGFEEIYDYQNNLAGKIGMAAKADYARWPEYGNEDVAARTERVQAMLRKSVAYCDRLFGYERETDPDVPSGDIYLRGSDLGNAWGANPEYRFRHAGSDVYELPLERISGEFKIAGEDWNSGNIDFGGPKNIEKDKETELTFRGGNMTVAGGEMRDVVLRFDWKKKTLTVASPSALGVVEAAGEAAAVYYNLQGMAVERPASGNVYIRVSGGESHLVLIP